MAVGRPHEPGRQFCAMIGRRISVVGTTGSGKSHVSRILAGLLHLQVHELDELKDSLLGGGQLDAYEFTRRVEDLTCLDEWIIDGHYVAVRDIIWQRADTVVLINYPLYVVFVQLIDRYLKKKLNYLSSDGRGSHNSGSNIHARKMGVWRQRWNRLLKTLRERQDYGRTLRLPQYDKLIVIELKSRRATRGWLQAVQAYIERHGSSEKPSNGAVKGVLSDGCKSLPI